MPVPGRAASESEKAPKAEHASEGSKKEKSEKGESKGSDEFTYLHLQPMIVPVVGKNGAEQLVTLMIDLQVKDISTSDEIRSKMPRVQDAILQALYGGFADGSLREGDRVEIVSIKARIASTLDKVLGEHLVDDVLIQGVAQRML